MLMSGGCVAGCSSQSSMQTPLKEESILCSGSGFLCCQTFEFGADIAEASGQAQANQGFGFAGSCAWAPPARKTAIIRAKLRLTAQ